MTVIKHDDFLNAGDFGFSFVDETEVAQQHSLISQESSDKKERDLQARLDKLYSTITPFLKNLQKNPEKKYIMWEDRTTKVTEFMRKLETIYKGVL